MTSNNTEKPWGGRFTAPTDEFVEQFTESVSYDQRLAHYDIMGSIAHVRMLAKVDVITKEESKQIISGLEQIEDDINANRFQWLTALEDVHMNIETALVQRIGDAGKKIHTGRSRNDQIATDIRLYLRDEIDLICEKLNQALNELVTLASEHTDTIMPGFTHMQSAQPVTFGHHLLAWAEMLLRDRWRLHGLPEKTKIVCH